MTEGRQAGRTAAISRARERAIAGEAARTPAVKTADLYFDICSLSYNLFALMRQILPLEFANKRAKYVRNRFYAIAAKVLQHGRQVIVKCQAQYYDLLRY